MGFPGVLSLTGVTLGGAVVTNAALDRPLGIGALTSTSCRYRVRLDSAGTVRLEYATNTSFTSSTTTTGVTVTASSDFTGGETITGLAANTTYYYRFIVDGTTETPDTVRTGGSGDPPFFKTAPVAGASFSVAFGSCMKHGGDERIFAAVKNQSPLAFVHLGDLHYVSDLVGGAGSQSLADLRSSVQIPHRNDHVSRWMWQRDIQLRMATEKIWDDHDYGLDNTGGDEALKSNALQVFNEYTPHHDYANDGNGIWRTWVWGDARFIALDGRYQRKLIVGDPVPRFPASLTNTAGTGTTTTTLVLSSGDSPTTTADAYRGYYAAITISGTTYYRRVTASTNSSGTVSCTLDRELTGLDDTATYFLKDASILDGFAIDDDQMDWLVSTANAATEKWVVICSPVVMNYTQVTDDNWAKIDTETVETKYIEGAITRDRVYIISGDMHRSAIDDGTNSPFPEALSSPLDKNNTEGAVSTWSNGQSPHPPGPSNPDGTESMFGILEISPTQFCMSIWWSANGTGQKITEITEYCQDAPLEVEDLPRVGVGYFQPRFGASFEPRTGVGYFEPRIGVGSI